MANDTLNVRFGDISHGWLPITFGIAGSDTLVDASDVPADPIAPLVSLGRFLLSPELGSRDVEFHLEPEYCTLTATKTADDQIDVCLTQSGSNLSQSGLSRVATATQIWRALRGIESSVRSAINDNQWSWDFPSTQMDMLASEIDTANAAH